MKLDSPLVIVLVLVGVLLHAVGCNESTSNTTADVSVEHDAKPRRITSPSDPPISDDAETEQRVVELEREIPTEQSTPADSTTEERAVSRSSGSSDFSSVLKNSDVRVPQVLLSKAYGDTCLRKVGDSLAEYQFTTADADARLQSLESSLGAKLTVVVFADLEFAPSEEQVRRLEQDVFVKYGRYDVAVVAVHVGDIQRAQEFRSQIPSGIALLADTENAYESISTMKPPRTFLLDSSGTIVWLDIEYSRSERVSLDNAIRFHLKQLFETAGSPSDRDWF
ncbi:MAG: hypothetical protein KDB27_02605 [Planctomycetales bacterium]|nr:hypothetical protein [Planctomycetales bacterium]